MTLEKEVLKMDINDPFQVYRNARYIYESKMRTAQSSRRCGDAVGEMRSQFDADNFGQQMLLTEQSGFSERYEQEQRSKKIFGIF